MKKMIMTWIVLLLVLAACGAEETAVTDTSSGSASATATSGPALRPVTREASGTSDTPTKEATPEASNETTDTNSQDAEPNAANTVDIAGILFQVMDKTEMDAADVALVYQRAGGLAGISANEYMWTFYTDGRVISSDGRSWEIAPEVISNLVGDMKNLGFFGLDENYIPEDTCCDRVFYAITLNTDEQAYTVFTLDGVDMPSALSNSIDEINELLVDISE
ncbi:MAG: hypothetical protein H6660_07040 [Ardenticatenaceae bacterium]|nr:hypothetical protein [Ardenticatenaceae bacterium]